MSEISVNEQSLTVDAGAEQTGAVVVSLSASQPEANVDPSLSGTFQRAATADKLTYARTIGLTGAVAGNATFDGSENVAINTALPVLTNAELEAMLT